MKRLAFFIVISVVVLAGFVALGHAAAPITATDQQTMQVAGQLYGNEQYLDAARLYQQLVDQGVVNMELYYNLGNAYAQVGDVGRSILNYTRAQRLAPRDPDIGANLDRVLQQADIEVDVLARSPFERLVDTAQSTFTTNELAVLVLAAWFGITLFWLMRPIFNAPVLRRLAGLALFLCAISLITGGYALGAIIYREQVAPAAVIVAPVTLAGANVQAGTEVSVMERRGEQLRVSLPGREVIGWIGIDSIEII